MDNTRCFTVSIKQGGLGNLLWGLPCFDVSMNRTETVRPEPVEGRDAMVPLGATRMKVRYPLPRWGEGILFDLEQPFGVLRRCFFDFLHIDSMNLGDLLRDLSDVGGFVAFAPVGSRC
jgi:hypothetical protein